MSTNLAIGIATGYALGSSSNAAPMSEEGAKITAIIMAGVVLAALTGAAINLVRRRMPKHRGKEWFHSSCPDPVTGALTGALTYICAVVLAAGVSALLS